MPFLDSDVADVLVKQVLAESSPLNISTLTSISSTCRALRNAALPTIFANVHWPHARKHDEVSGLLFFPESLWPFFRRFELDWPDDWPEATPPRWGDRYYAGGDYHPRHLDKLTAALPKMPSVRQFYISCPFYPPNSLLNALIQCRSLRDLVIDETPITMIPRIPPSFLLESFTIIPVAEAVRVGEGPSDPKYTESAYYVREYRKKYKNDILARNAATSLLFQFGKPAYLRHIQLSVDMFALDNFFEHEWPNVDTLILTGHTPKGSTQLIDVLARMPLLRDLRLLFAATAKKTDPVFSLLQDNLPTAKNTDPKILHQLQYLAVSNACNPNGAFRHTGGLERLAVVAITDQPRVPVAFSRTQVDQFLADLAVSNRMQENRLTKLRIMMEDKVNPELCSAIAEHCPYLQALEVEVCGYHDGKSIHEWSEYADAFSPLTDLNELRICIQFPEFDELDRFEPWRAARRECAQYLATKLHRIQRIGFEYRKRTGPHRFEDGWLEFDITWNDKTGTIELTEVGPNWYPFPEMWVSMPIPGSG